jgi:hypothetical protein
MSSRNYIIAGIGAAVAIGVAAYFLFREEVRFRSKIELVFVVFIVFFLSSCYRLNHLLHPLKLQKIHHHRIYQAMIQSIKLPHRASRSFPPQNPHLVLNQVNQVMTQVFQYQQLYPRKFCKMSCKI